MTNLGPIYGRRYDEQIFNNLRYDLPKEIFLLLYVLINYLLN